MQLRRKDEEEVAIDMSPMIDMVFLLLIFFIVASQIVKIEKVPIEVPSAVYAKVPEDETGRFIITVDPEGNMFVDPGSKEVEIEDLPGLIEPELIANEKLRVVIRADGTTKYEYCEKIMLACAEVGANDMIFAAYEE